MLYSQLSHFKSKATLLFSVMVSTTVFGTVGSGSSPERATNAPLVQWTVQGSSKPLMGVRFSHGVQQYGGVC